MCSRQYLSSREKVEVVFGVDQVLPLHSQSTHLFFFQPLLLGLDVLLNSHVNELVLCLGLHHARPLPAHHLDRLGDVDIAVQTCSQEREDEV